MIEVCDCHQGSAALGEMIVLEMVSYLPEGDVTVSV